jgi:hypothetical protein
VAACPHCGQPMSYHDTRSVSWLACWGRVQAPAAGYRCRACQQERRPLLDLLGVEPGRICGWLARWLAVLATVAPYEFGGPSGGSVIGGPDQCHGCLAGGAALGAGGSQLQ